MPADTQSGMVKWFASCGFKTNPLTKMCRSVELLLQFHREIEAERAGLDYDIDGVVYKVDRPRLAGAARFHVAQRRAGRSPQVSGREGDDGRRTSKSRSAAPARSRRSPSWSR